MSIGGSCISNALKTGSNIHYITQVNNKKIFFDRKRELNMFNNAFSDDPELHVILSPSSRKPALVREVGDYAPPPILIVDEANLISQLGDSSKEREILLKSFLNWLMINTKQENRFHAVLTPSDLFFFFELDCKSLALHIPHATPYVVGDLSKEEANEYFEKYVLPRYECRITGTRMLIIDRYVKEYKILEGKLADREFSVFRLKYGKLRSGLVPARSPDKPHDPLWNLGELIKVMKAVVKAENKGGSNLDCDEQTSLRVMEYLLDDLNEAS
ncbi:18332_t:CDS:2 [Acaulospora morrowiae]|uniref:18332_t:CDS:1 n=1 Tax=Acaulospora morrowiae TaxID=94023 RepID=A0A9N9CHP7_9GLOM|nr:18332_t:CDS:2 [Acaulospora morrowiae]